MEINLSKNSIHLEGFTVSDKNSKCKSQRGYPLVKNKSHFLFIIDNNYIFCALDLGLYLSCENPYPLKDPCMQPDVSKPDQLMGL